MESKKECVLCDSKKEANLCSSCSKAGSDNKHIAVVILALITFIYATGFYIINFFAAKNTSLGNKYEYTALFGDSFGSINALFSALAFGGVIYTILLQRKELKLQRDELSLTRNELSKSAKAANTQADLMYKQTYLQVLPMLIENQRDVVNSKNSLISSKISLDHRKVHFKNIELQKAPYQRRIHDLQKGIKLSNTDPTHKINVDAANNQIEQCKEVIEALETLKDQLEDQLNIATFLREHSIPS